MIRAGRRPFPDEFLFHGVLEWVEPGRVADQAIKAGIEVLHPVNEQAEVDKGPPGKGVERELLRTRNRLSEDLVQRLPGNPGSPVQGETASPLMDHLAKWDRRRPGFERFPVSEGRAGTRSALGPARCLGDIPDDSPINMLGAELIGIALPGKVAERCRDVTRQILRFAYLALRIYRE